jgi:acetyl esterase
MTLDPDIRKLLDHAAEAGGYELGSGSVEKDREAAMHMVDFQEPVIELPRVEDVSIPGPAGPLAARVYWPAEDPVELPIVLFWHGGGWQMGGLETVDRPVRAFAARAGVIVVSASHRLAPEHPYPAAVEDGSAALRWVAEEAERLGGSADRIVVAGESSGGNVAAAVALRAREEGGPQIAHQFLITPSLDSDPDRPSIVEFGEGHLLTAKMMKLTRSRYYGPELEAIAATREFDRLPDTLAPVRAADLSNLPTATVITCECDPVRDEGEAYAAALAAAGVEVRQRRFDGLTHGSLNLAAAVPAAHEYALAVSQMLSDAVRQ